MLDDDGVESDLELFDHQPEHALAIGDFEELGRIVELGEKPFQALGKHHVHLGVEEFSLQGATR